MALQVAPTDSPKPNEPCTESDEQESSLIMGNLKEKIQDDTGATSTSTSEEDTPLQQVTTPSPVRAIISKIEGKVAKQQRLKQKEEEIVTTRRNLSRNSTFNTQRSGDSHDNSIREDNDDNTDQEDEDPLQEELKELHKQVDTDVNNLEHLEQDFMADIERIMSHGSLELDNGQDNAQEIANNLPPTESTAPTADESYSGSNNLKDTPPTSRNLFGSNFDQLDHDGAQAMVESKTTTADKSSQNVFRQGELMDGLSNSKNQSLSPPDNDDNAGNVQDTTTIQNLESFVAQAENRLSVELEQVQQVSQERSHPGTDNPQEPQSDDNSNQNHNHDHEEEESVTSRSVEAYQRHKDELIHAFEDESEAEDKEIRETEARILDYQKQKEEKEAKIMKEDHHDKATNTPVTPTTIATNEESAWESPSPGSNKEPTTKRQPSPPKKPASASSPPFLPSSSYNKFQKQLQRQVYRHQSWLLPALGMVMSNLAPGGTSAATLSFGPQMSSTGITFFEFRM